MSDSDVRVQELTREIERLQIRIAELEQLHFVDQAEIVYQRRQIDFLMDAGREAKGNG